MTYKSPEDDQIYCCGACGWRGTYDLGYCPECSFLTYLVKPHRHWGCFVLFCLAIALIGLASLVAVCWGGVKS